MLVPAIWRILSCPSQAPLLLTEHTDPNHAPVAPYLGLLNNSVPTWAINYLEAWSNAILSKETIHNTALLNSLQAKSPTH